MGFVVKRGENYSARIAIPKALRPILGRNEFKKSLGTTSKKEAELLAAPLVLRWKKLIEEAKTDGFKAKAKALRQAFSSDKNNDKLDEDGAMEVFGGASVTIISSTFKGGAGGNADSVFNGLGGSEIIFACPAGTKGIPVRMKRQEQLQAGQLPPAGLHCSPK